MVTSAVPDLCTKCGRRRRVEAVLTEYNEDGSPTGAFELWCWPCLAEDLDGSVLASLEADA